MAKPTLYDMARTNLPKGRISTADRHANNALAHHMKEAVPFVIDDDTVRAAQALRNTFLNQKTYCLLDVALLPFQTTWIEYDPRVKDGVIETDETATRFGHMIFRSEHGVSVITVEAFKKNFYAMPYVFNWTEPDMVAPVRQHIGGTDGRTTSRVLQHPEFFRETLLLGKQHKNTPPAPDWIERFGGDTYQPAISSKRSALQISTQMSELLTEHAGTASLLMGILAIMAFVPTRKTVMAPSGRWTGAGVNGTKPFFRHTVVRVETGERQVYRTVTNAIREAQKRAQHDVREHWRVYRRGRPDEYRVRVESHKRGDPSIGIITHDHYETVRVHRER